jgi:hypothetical protein
VVRGRAGREPVRARRSVSWRRPSQPDLADFADFVQSSPARMVRLAELLTGDRGRAEDLAQDGYAGAVAADHQPTLRSAATQCRSPGIAYGMPACAITPLV